MSSMNEFEKYQREIFELLEELYDFSEDKHYSKNLISQIKEKIEGIKKIDINTLSEEQLDDINGFIDYLNDILKTYKLKFDESEPSV